MVEQWRLFDSGLRRFKAKLRLLMRPEAKGYPIIYWKEIFILLIIIWPPQTSTQNYTQKADDRSLGSCEDLTVWVTWQSYGGKMWMFWGHGPQQQAAVYETITYSEWEVGYSPVWYRVAVSSFHVSSQQLSVASHDNLSLSSFSKEIQLSVSFLH